MAALDGLKAALERIILNPQYAPLLAVLKAARNGAVYGSKVRFPHALVMIFLFRSGTLREKSHLIYRATRRHALNLAQFATIYKLSMLLLPHLAGRASLPDPSKREHPADALVAGCLGGYYVFGRRNPHTGAIPSVNMQIVVYIFARVVLALAKLAVKPGHGVPVLSEPARSDAISRNAWPVFAAASWGMVMWLFRHHPADLQGSLRSSMVYIYKDCDDWDSLRNFFWHNK